MGRSVLVQFPCANFQPSTFNLAHGSRQWSVFASLDYNAWASRRATVIETYAHGYDPRENKRLLDQAGTLVDLLHSDTSYPSGSVVLEAGCGVGAQTVTLAQRSPGAGFTSIDVSTDSLAEAKRKTAAAGLT